MLSYRHAFHAGNHADVLKHFIFAEVLRYFTQKDKPFWVIDSHAGAGMYQLENKFLKKMPSLKMVSPSYMPLKIYLNTLQAISK